MSSVNKVILVGNLGRDPEVRRTSNGDAVVSFSIATAEMWKDKSTGERKEKTEWHNVVIWNEHIGKVAETYLKKGSKVYLEGQLQTREYTDKDGNQRKSTEVVLSRFRGELVLLGEKAAEKPKDEAQNFREAVGQSFGRPVDETRAYTREELMAAGRNSQPDDDIPF